MKHTVAGCLAFSLILWSAGCATMDNEQQGTVLGAAGGAIVGGLIGHDSGNTLFGAIIGAAIGGAAGAFIGRYMDQQAAEMRQDIEGGRIERVSEGIRISFDAALFFEGGMFVLNDYGQHVLISLGVILNRYPDTTILIEGHTDPIEIRERDIALSEHRAQAMAEYLSSRNVDRARFSVRGYGPDQPIAGNARVEGRRLNRRMDIAIMANDRLKRTARERR